MRNHLDKNIVSNFWNQHLKESKTHKISWMRQWRIHSNFLVILFSKYFLNIGSVGFFAWWHIKHGGLFNAKSNHLEEQQL